MNLLSITQSYLSDASTDIAGIFVHRQFQALKSKGWDVRVINPQHFLHRELKGSGRYYPQSSIRDGISVWRPRFLWFPRLVENAGFALEHSYAIAVARVIPVVTAGWEPDLIVGDWLVPGGFGAAQMARRFRVPLVLRARGQDVPVIVRSSLSSRRYNQHYRRILEEAAHITCQGQGVYDQMARSNLYGDLIAREKISVVTNGVDTSLFHPPVPGERLQARANLHLPHDALVWFYSGRWEEEKGSREFSVALKELIPRFPQVYFMAAGPIRDAKSCEEMKKLSDRIRFIGPQAPDAIANLLRASDVFVLPSHREGLPNSVLEAMACGLVTIATAVGGIPSLIKDGVNGILIQDRSSGALADALGRCSENLITYRPLGEAARRTIFSGHYDLGSVVESVNELFYSLVRAHSEAKAI